MTHYTLFIKQNHIVHLLPFIKKIYDLFIILR